MYICIICVHIDIHIHIDVQTCGCTVDRDPIPSYWSRHQDSVHNKYPKHLKKDWKKPDYICTYITYNMYIYIYTYYYVSVYNLYISMLIYFLGTYIGYGLIFFLLERCVKSQGKLGASTGAKDADAFPSPQSESAGAPNAAATVRMVLSEEFLEPPGGVSMNSLSQFHFQGFKIQKKIYIRFFARLVSTN